MSRIGRRILGVLGGAVLIGLLVVVLGPRYWPRNDQPSGKAPDAVVALGAGVSGDTTLYHIEHDRLLVAAILAKRSPTALIITTQQPKRGTAVQQKLIDSVGLVDRWKVAPGLAETTRQEALQVAGMLPRGASIVVVTSQQHTRRACATFETVGFRVTCAAAGIGPSGEELYEFLYEMAGVAKYRFKGWIK